MEEWGKWQISCSPHCSTRFTSNTNTRARHRPGSRRSRGGRTPPRGGRGAGRQARSRCAHPARASSAFTPRMSGCSNGRTSGELVARAPAARGSFTHEPRQLRRENVGGKARGVREDCCPLPSVRSHTQVRERGRRARVRALRAEPRDENIR